MSQNVAWMEGKDVPLQLCQGVKAGSQMCQRSRWSSLCLPGSGAEGWDLFFFVSEKWLYPSCAGAGAGAAAKVLPDGAGPTRAFWGRSGL